MLYVIDPAAPRPCHWCGATRACAPLPCSVCKQSRGYVCVDCQAALAGPCDGCRTPSDYQTTDVVSTARA